MHWRIGVLGIGLVAALVAGGSADGPSHYVVPSDPPGASTEAQGFSAEPSVTAVSGAATGTIGAAPMHPEASKTGPQVASAGQMIGFNGFNGSGTQTITLVHTGKMQIAVYHIERSGQIRLVSSRPIDADFSLSLNVTAPLPGEIRMLSGRSE